jgi:hypothetical protein
VEKALEALDLRDLDLLRVDAGVSGSQRERLRHLPMEKIPLSCDALVLTPEVHEQLLATGSRMAQALQSDILWQWERLE